MCGKRWAAAVDLKSRCELALLLLLVGTARHYGWAMAEVATRGLVSKALGGMAILALLWIVHGLTHSRLLLPVLLWWAWEELQVVTASVWFIFDPWPVPAGESMLSARAGFDLGAAGILVVALLVAHLHKNLSDRTAIQQTRDLGK